MSEQQVQNKAVTWTIPNLLCAFRLVGSFGLVGLAVADRPYWFVGWFGLLALTDLVDGTLARLLAQRSDLGAHLDSAADVTLSICFLAGAMILRWEIMQHEWVLIGIAAVSYLVVSAFGFWKFRRLPAYHTLSAKATQTIAVAAGVCLVLDWSVWPLRIAAVAAILTNLESAAITHVLDDWKTDVRSLFAVIPGNSPPHQ